MVPPLLAPDEPPAFTTARLAGRSPCVLLCEHASCRLPRRLGDLGLPERERGRHIGWDIGAAALAEALSARLDAPLFSTGYSRLVVDCNRPPERPSSIPERSEDTVIPGNLALSPEERAARLDALFHPFHDAVAAHLDARAAQGRRSCVVGVHSFTPVFRGATRPWPVGILYASATGFARALIGGLRALGLEVGDNQPYRIDADDYTVPVHGEARGLPALLVEVRQDLLAGAADVALWAGRLAPLLEQAMAALEPKETTP
ncbi:MAG TPA: N-formylglutamate amidohydrolase [Roseomonas sp.]|nr:N-formylglutamate amidohydrolase [Roseomonas sp.]